MNDICIGTGGSTEFCFGAEWVLMVLTVECCFYVLVFVGGWEWLRRVRKPNERVRYEREDPWRYD